MTMYSDDEFYKLLEYYAEQLRKQPHFLFGGGLSPTDVDSKGMYPYQEPEVDEQGTYYGYKILVKCHCGCNALRSPRYMTKWSDDGELYSDQEPNDLTMHGIHCTKRADNPALDEYSNYSSLAVLVRCALSGTIVETEQGFRAEHAIITGVFEDGNWKSYQDYKECATTDTHINPQDERNWWNQKDYRIAHPTKSGSGKLLP